MVEILKSEVIVVLLEKEEGVYFEEFAGLFHQVHGYQFKLANHGYKSLKDMLDDMKDEVELLNINGLQLIKYRPVRQLNVISPWPQTGDIPLDEFPKELPSCEQNMPDHLFTRKDNYMQPISSHQNPAPTMVGDVNSTKQKSFHSIQKPSGEIVKIISERVISHQLGLKPKKLKKYIMNQHNIDLELYSKQLGYEDMLSMLKQIPGIGFTENSKENVLIALGSQDKDHNSRPAQPKKDPFSYNKVVDVLRMFPSGLKVQNLKQYVLKMHGIDLEVLSQERGYTDLPSMLKQVSGITSLKGDVFVASNVHKSTAQPVQVKNVKFSEKAIVDFVKAFPSGLKVEKLSQHMKKKYKIDLMKYSQEKGSTDVNGILKNIPGITIVNANVVMASEVTSHKKSNATCKATPAKCPNIAGTRVTKNHIEIKTPRGTQTVPKPSTTKPIGTSQQIPLPTHHIPLTNLMMTRSQGVQQGLCPNVSYASALVNNLRKDQIHVQSPQLPPNFNVQKVQAAKATHPNYKEAPIGVLPSSTIRNNVQLLLKSHANGLSIFQLKKLYLFNFKQPFVCKGLSARKLLMTMKDVAKIKGVGVQMKVFPALSEEEPSVSTNKYSAPQGTASSVAKDGKDNEVLPHLQVSGPLSVKNSAEHAKHIAPVPLSKHQPSSSGFIQTELTGGHISIYSSEDINHKHFNHNQPMTGNCGSKLLTPAVAHQADNSSVLGSPFSKMNKSFHPAGDISDAQWPSLPQKLNILKEIEQRTKRSDQLHKNIQHNEPCFRQNPTVTSQPQGKDRSAQTSLQTHRDPNESNGKINYTKQALEPQASDLAHPIPQSGFSFVMEETGFSFVKAETIVDQEKQSLKVICTGPPPKTFTDSAQVAFGNSEAGAGSNTYTKPLQPNQSAPFNMASQIKGSAPEATKNSVNVSSQQKTSHFSSQNVPQQTYNHLMTSGTMTSLFSMTNQKSNDLQSHHKSFLELKSQQAAQTSLQAQGMQLSCASEQVLSKLSEKQRDASLSKTFVRESQQHPP